jgi:hypothetical protein
MEIEILLSNEFATLWLYPETRIVHHQFHKAISGQAFQEVLNLGLKQFKEGRANKWLSDDRLNTILPFDDSAWSNGFWLPQMLKAGWTRWAIVLPEKQLGQINMRRLIRETAGNKVAAETFFNTSDALAWLELVVFGQALG